MSQPEIEARLDLLAGRKRGSTRYVSTRRGKPRP